MVDGGGGINAAAWKPVWWYSTTIVFIHVTPPLKAKCIWEKGHRRIRLRRLLVLPLQRTVPQSYYCKGKLGLYLLVHYCMSVCLFRLHAVQYGTELRKAPISVHQGAPFSPPCLHPSCSLPSGRDVVQTRREAPTKLCDHFALVSIIQCSPHRNRMLRLDADDHNALGPVTSAATNCHCNIPSFGKHSAVSHTTIDKDVVVCNWCWLWTKTFLPAAPITSTNHQHQRISLIHLFIY